MSLEDQIRECLRLADEARVRVDELGRQAKEELRRAEVLGAVLRTLYEQLERERRERRHQS